MKAVSKIETHILCSIAFFYFNHVVYEIMGANIAMPDKLQTKIRRMRISCSTSKTAVTQIYS